MLLLSFFLFFHHVFLFVIKYILLSFCLFSLLQLFPFFSSSFLLLLFFFLLLVILAFVFVFLLPLAVCLLVWQIYSFLILITVLFLSLLLQLLVFLQSFFPFKCANPFTYFIQLVENSHVLRNPQIFIYNIYSLV